MTVNVNTTTDDYGANALTCSLREAVQATNTDTAFSGCTNGTGDDVIVLPSGTYNLTQPGVDDTNAGGDLDLGDTANDSLSIVGTGTVVIKGAGADRVLHHTMPGDLEISNVKISGGVAQGVADGGGILNQTGPLRMQNVTIQGNAAPVDGGGITNYSTATLSNVTISGNSTLNDGGGLYGAGGSATTLRNVTVAFNTTDVDATGGGDGGGIGGSGNISTFNTIIGDNLDSSPDPADKSPDCATGPNFFPRYTLIENFTPSTCLVGFNPGTNIAYQDPMLETLAANGGTTPTHALREGSPAIDAGGSAPPDECLPMDQRGIVRPQFAACDLGAFERKPAPPVVRCDGRIATRVGDGGRNVIQGTSGRDVIAGLGGTDTIRGLGGNDVVCGGRGNDFITGGRGNDKLLGQRGADTIRGAAGRDWLKGGPGRDRLLGGAGRDRLGGGPGPDRLNGGPGRDRLNGGPGRDNVTQ